MFAILQILFLVIYSLSLVLFGCFSFTFPVYSNISPSFPIQEISDKSKDFVGIQNAHYKITNITKCENIGNNLHMANIQSIKYISDGKFLNATVWLSDPFSYRPNLTIFNDVNSSLNVGFYPINSNTTSQYLLDASIKDKEIYKYFNVIENRTFVTKNNDSAYGLVYNGRSSGIDGYEKEYTKGEIGIIRDDRVIVMKFSTIPALFSSIRPIVYTIVDSLEFSTINKENFIKSDNYSIYTNSKYNISMLYPSNWIIRDATISYNSYSNYTEIAKFDFVHSHYDENANSRAIETYSMVIDVHSTFDKGSDYIISHGWDSAFKKDGWIKSIYEISSDGHLKLLDRERNIYKNKNDTFFNNNFNSIDFDLTKANFPNQYSVYIYKQNIFDIDNYSCMIVDQTGWLPIPPPHFSISAFPDTLELRPNDEKNVKITIHNNSSLNSEFSISNIKNSQLNMTINPSIVSLLPNGDSNINLRIKNISNNTKESISYTIPLKLSISFPQNTTIFGENVTLTNTEGAKTVQSYFFTTTILPNLEIKDHLNNLVEWLSPLNSVWTFLVAIGTVIIPLLIRLFSKQSKNG
jgi:hypothetical protein